METYNATIDRTEKNETLELILGQEVLKILLTEDKPNEVKAVFNKLLEHLQKGEFEFNLTDTKEDLYHHICKEYITQLNAELKSTFKELQDNELVIK